MSTTKGFKFSKKYLVLFIFIFVITAVLGGCAKNIPGSASSSVSSAQPSTPAGTAAPKTEPPKELITVNVAYQPNVHGAGPIAVGEEKGFFKENGIKINAVKFLSGPPEFQAMAAGDIDIAYIGPGAVFLVAQGQGKILTIDNTYYGDTIIATKKSGVTKIQDMKGKMVTVPKGTSGDALLNLALNRNGMKIDDINAVNMDVAGCVASFVAGKSDILAIWAPYTFEIEKKLGKENVVTIATNRSFPDTVSPGSWVVRPSLLEKNEDAVVRFMKGWTKANDYRKSHLEETAKLVAKMTQVPEDELLGMAQPELTDFYESSKLKAMMEDGSANKLYDVLVKNFVTSGQLKEYVDPKNFVVPGPISKALAK